MARRIINVINEEQMVVATNPKRRSQKGASSVPRISQKGQPQVQAAPGMRPRRPPLPASGNQMLLGDCLLEV